MTSYEAIEALAGRIRICALKACAKSHASHIGSGLSCADILAALYSGWLNVSPETISDPDRDRFILSKGHAAAAYYGTLAESGFIPKHYLELYCQDDSPLGGHVHHSVPGVEVSTGSLGHGLPVGVGMAIAGKRAGRNYRVVVLMSDGEMNCGSNWEAIMLASAQKLDNVLAIVDKNGLQAMGRTEDVLPLGDLTQRWTAFGWKAAEIDGHSIAQIEETLTRFPFAPDAPSVIIANTIKGKGVSFMENRLEWHYRSPNEHELAQAIAELSRRRSERLDTSDASS
jgi:transketolase